MYHNPRDSSIKALTVIRSKSRSVKRGRPQSDDQERTDNQQQCSLLNLPAELRLQIWEYIAPYNKAIRIYGSGLTVRCFICEGLMFESVQKLPKWPRDPLHRGDPCVNCGRSSSGRYLPETPPEVSKEGWRGFPTLLVLCRLIHHEIAYLIYNRNFFQFGDAPASRRCCFLLSNVGQDLLKFCHSISFRNFDQLRHLAWKAQFFRQDNIDWQCAERESQRLARLLLEMPNLHSFQMLVYRDTEVYGEIRNQPPSSWLWDGADVSAAAVVEFLEPFDRRDGHGKWVLYVPRNIQKSVELALKERKNAFRESVETVRLVPGFTPQTEKET